MNLLYIHSHDTGRYIQPIGHPVSTPRLQQLAEKGVLFRQAFTVNPTCSPSRASLLTGQYPHCNGMLGLAHRGFSLAEPDHHLVRFLKSHGYGTALSGFQHEAHDEATLGYDELLCPKGPGRTRQMVATQAAEFLSRKHKRPFFLAVGFTETHKEFPPPGPDDDPRYTVPPGLLPDTPDTRSEFAGFKTMARQLDESMGQVFDALEAGGHADETLVLCTTDHGLPLPGMKCNLTDHGTGVFLILRGPGGLSGGKVVDAMVTHLDVFPTLCELAGLEAPDRLQGKSLLPLVRGETGTLHEEIFAETNYHAAYEPARAVRTTRFKYIRKFHEYPGRVLPNCDDGEAKTCLTDGGWGALAQPEEQLYDLLFDPQERNNLAAHPEQRATLEDLRTRLDRWMHATADPLLNGPIPLPEGGILTRQDAFSPSER